MVYEYEDKINDAFFKASRSGRNVNRELLKELQEVYRKAKMFDEIENNFPSSKSPEDFGEIVQQILIEHKERADDER